MTGVRDTGRSPGTTLSVMQLAARMRRGKEPMSPFRLWSAAKSEGASYLEAMIHAGAIGPKADDEWQPYAICPDCGEDLGPFTPTHRTA